MEGDDPTDLAQHVAEWADVIDLEVNPVVEDAAAAEAASRVFGKIASNCNLMLSERRRVREYFSCARFLFSPAKCTGDLPNAACTSKIVP